MKQKAWKTKIKKNCIDAGTYAPMFDAVIDTLASILENRDATLDAFIASGGDPVVEHTNQGGNTNFVKNPALVLTLDLNSQALTYWRELGLTPAGLKKLNEQAVKAEGKKSLLEEALTKLDV